MPIFTPKTVKTDDSDGAGNPCGPYRAELYSDSGGLTQFGAFVEVLPPGSKSSIKHWHAGEDEMVYMIAGVAQLHEGDAVTALHPGQAATFKAGDPAGHCLENTSDEEARYLVIGTRSPGDVVTYPDHDRMLHWDRPSKSRQWTDHAGQPASNPYQLDPKAE